MRSLAISVVVALMTCLLPLQMHGEPSPPSTNATAACVRAPGCHRLFVVAHRAKGFGAPENTRAAVTRAVEAGVPLVKIDLRLSRDGQLFVMHDGTLQRTTTRRGRIDTVPSEELARARLANGESVARFEEIYTIARGRTMLVLGFTANVVERVADWIDAQGSFDDAIFFVNTGDEMEAAASRERA